MIENTFIWCLLSLVHVTNMEEAYDLNCSQPLGAVQILGRFRKTFICFHHKAGELRNPPSSDKINLVVCVFSIARSHDTLRPNETLLRTGSERYYQYALSARLPIKQMDLYVWNSFFLFYMSQNVPGHFLSPSQTIDVCDPIVISLVQQSNPLHNLMSSVECRVSWGTLRSWQMCARCVLLYLI